MEEINRIKTPRGLFIVKDKTMEEIKADGFFHHHSSDDGDYDIVSDGKTAYAIPHINVK